MYRTCANRIEAALLEAFPKAAVLQNPHGKPRKGAFEVTLSLPVGESKVHVRLFSKLATHGPAKSREYLPDPQQLVTEILPKTINITRENPLKESLQLVDVVEPDARQPEQLTVAQLRDQLRQHNLPTTGLKAELISRLRGVNA
jgi:hypothetical protein